MIQSLVFKEATQTVAPTNHVIVTDISGSMYDVLPDLRTHLKENLASLVKPQDTISLLYFSSKGDFGSIFTGRQINSATDISELNTLIDRFLKPSGCTGFVEPLKLAIDTANNLTKAGFVNSLVFMTDGYDNCWRSDDILKVAGQLSNSFENITIIEYGWYCNRDLLQKMAERCGAKHVFAEGQTEYQTELESAMRSSTPKFRVDFGTGFSHVLYLENGCYVVLPTQVDEVDNSIGFVSLPETAKKAWLIPTDVLEHVGDLTDVQTAYVMALYGVHTMTPELVWAALKKTGDVRFINQFNNCFTKQDYSNIKVDLTEAIIDESMRGIDGTDYNLVPDEDATTVVDVLTFLAEHDVKLATGHKSFSYKRIGRKAIQKEDDTEDKLVESIAEATTKEQRKALAIKLAQHEDWNPQFDINPKSTGVVDISNLVYNSERPNISIQTVQDGFVSVPEEYQNKYKLPESIETMRYRNYAIVKDGIINMKTLPLVFEDPSVVKQMRKELGVSVLKRGPVYVLNLGGVPLVNRLMVKNISASTFFADHVRLESLKARQKVLKHFRTTLVGQTNAMGLSAKYGAEAAAFLSGYGIRDYGFSPKSTRTESTDVYMSRELNIKIKGASSLPSIAAVLKKPEAKHNTADKMIFKEIKAYEDFVNSPALSSVSDEVKSQLIQTWIKDATTNTIKEVRELNKSLSKVMYGIVAGHGWFNDLGDDESAMTIEVDGEQYVVSAELVEKEIKI